MDQAWQSLPSLQPQIHWLDRTLITMMEVQEALIVISNVDGALIFVLSFFLYWFYYVTSLLLPILRPWIWRQLIICSTKS